LLIKIKNIELLNGYHINFFAVGRVVNTIGVKIFDKTKFAMIS